MAGELKLASPAEMPAVLHFLHIPRKKPGSRCFCANQHYQCAGDVTLEAILSGKHEEFLPISHSPIGRQQANAVGKKPRQVVFTSDIARALG